MRLSLNGTEIFFDVDGAKLAIDAGGSVRERPTVVVLPGGPGFDHVYLRAGLSPLAADAQLVFVDPRGCGRSGRPPLETWTLDQVAADVVGLCERLGIERPFVFGHSAGGFVALTMAWKHPDLVRGLLLCDTVPALRPHTDAHPPPASLEQRAPAEVAAIKDRFFGGDMSDESMALFASEVVPYYAGPAHMEAARAVGASGGMEVSVAKHFFGTRARAYDMHPVLGDIRVPTLVMVGAHDWVCSPAASRAIAAKIPGAELVVFETAGHFGFAEVPAEFQGAVRAFLARVAV